MQELPKSLAFVLAGVFAFALLLMCGYCVPPAASELHSNIDSSDHGGAQSSVAIPEMTSGPVSASSDRVAVDDPGFRIVCRLRQGDIGLARREVGCRGLTSDFGCYERTDAGGEALIAVPGPGTYGIWYAFLEGVEVVVTAQGEYPVTLNVPPGEGVRVVVTAAGAPVEAAVVWLSQVASPAIGTVVGRTDAAGALALDGPCEGSFVSVRHDAMGAVHGVRVAAQDVEIVLPGRPCGVRGRVALRGAPVAGCRIICADNDQRGFELRAVTSADGAFSFDGLAAGIVDLVADKEGAGAGACEVVARSGEHTDVTIVLSGGCSIEGRVTDQNARPIAGAVVLARASQRRLPTSRRTDGQGRYRFDRLSVGRVDLYASAGGVDEGSVRSQSLNVSEGKVERWDPVLTVLPPLISGSVTRPEGKGGIRGARVRALVGGRVIAEAISGPLGDFCIYSQVDSATCDVQVLEVGRLLPTLRLVGVLAPTAGLRLVLHEAASGKIRATLPLQLKGVGGRVLVRASGSAESEIMAYNDEREYYESLALAGGRYEVALDGPRIAGGWMPVEVADGVPVYVSLSGGIGGDVEVVLDPQPSASRVAVLLRDENLKMIESMSEVERLRYQSKCVRPGTYLVEVRCRGAAWTQQYVRVDSGQTARIRLRLLPGEELRIPWKDLRIPDGLVGIQVRLAGTDQVVYAALEPLEQLRRGRTLVLAAGTYEVVTPGPEPAVVWKGATTPN